MNMSWLREDADERLSGLFSDDPEAVQAAMADLLDAAREDPEIEELLLETLQTSLDEHNDDTQASAWIAVLLGELGTIDALGALQAAIVSEDEVLAGAATRALQRIGPPAFEMLLELIEDDPHLEPRVYAASVEVLRAVEIHDVPTLRRAVEEALLHGLMRDVASGAPTRAALLRMEVSAVALARMGVAQARPSVEAALALAGGQNAFLLEALEILDEQPLGIPFSDTDWMSNVGSVLDDLDAGDPQTGSDGMDVSVTETPRERIVTVRRPPPQA